MTVRVAMDREFFERLAVDLQQEPEAVDDDQLARAPRARPRTPASRASQHRAIGFWGALAMSVAAMGPLLGALSVAPLIASQAGFSTPFIFLVAWIAMFAVALTIGRFSSVLPGAASIYSYITHGLGERAGFLAAWLSFSYYLLFVPLLLAAIGIYGAAMANDVFNVEHRLVDLGAARRRPSSRPWRSSASACRCAST